MTKDEVTAKILNTAGNILSGKASETEIKETIQAAREAGLLAFVKKQFEEITKLLKS